MSDYGDFCREQRAERSKKNTERERRVERDLHQLALTFGDVQMLPPDSVHDYWTLRVGTTEARFWARTGTALFQLPSGAMDRKARYYEPKQLVRALRNEEQRRRAELRSAATPETDPVGSRGER